jgi:hypothetical protein
MVHITSQKSPNLINHPLGRYQLPEQWAKPGTAETAVRRGKEHVLADERGHAQRRRRHGSERGAAAAGLHHVEVSR